ncbi:carboxymuconolactone decarboxylase family protein [Desulfobacterota bacterium AH_259_B03_O07]|nr:carboxymuconolactone decarboxylase family protein [Desulfobacterota bacterium AH_259_B03_O07]
MAKIPYVEREDAPENIQGMYDALQKKFGVVPNVIKAMANSPELMSGFMPFLGAALGPSKVSGDIKELAILTTSKLNGCSYCTAHHTAAGKRAGLTDEKIAAADDPDSDALDDKEKAVVRYSAELAKNVAASDEALNELRKHFDDAEIAEITLVAGVFHVLTRFADTFKVELER